jgi:dTDP-4-amino-4,6-dideoxygalactose transaminase
MEIRKEFLSIAIPDISELEIYEVLDALKSGWISVGPKVREFEQKFAEWHGVKHAIALSSCTSALFIAAKVIGIQKGDYVIVPTISWQSTANIVEQLEAIPLFADVDIDTMNISKEWVEKYIKEYKNKIKLIIPVHFSGLPVDIDYFNDISDKYGIPIIYDDAHAVFSEYKGKMIGQYGEMSCFSFYATKNLTMGDGGIITTNSDHYAEQCRIWSYHGLPKDAWQRYSKEAHSPHVQCIVPGYKFNLTDLQAALGLAQLKRREELLKKRNELFNYYNELLKDFNLIKTPILETEHAKWGNHVYVIKILNDRVNRDALMIKLKEFNIGTNLHFYPIHKNYYYEKKYPNINLPNAEWLMNKILTLPLCSKYDKNDIKYVVEVIKFLLNN